MPAAPAVSSASTTARSDVPGLDLTTLVRNDRAAGDAARSRSLDATTLASHARSLEATSFGSHTARDTSTVRARSRNPFSLVDRIRFMEQYPIHFGGLPPLQASEPPAAPLTERSVPKRPRPPPAPAARRALPAAYVLPLVLVPHPPPLIPAHRARRVARGFGSSTPRDINLVATMPVRSPMLPALRGLTPHRMVLSGPRPATVRSQRDVVAADRRPRPCSQHAAAGEWLFVLCVVLFCSVLTGMLLPG